jgi:hypothetical protein
VEDDLVVEIKAITNRRRRSIPSRAGSRAEPAFSSTAPSR